MPGAVPSRVAAADPLVLLRRGRQRTSVELRDLRDRWLASDPGGLRIRQGLRAVVAVGSTIGVEYGVAAALGAPALLLMMIGAVVSMLMANAIAENHRRRLLVTAGGAPVAAAVGASLAIPLHSWIPVAFAVFVLVSMAAVWVRRFGPRWFAYGFLAWQAYFFSLFLHPPLAALPLVLLGILVASVWTTVLLLSILWDDPAARLRRTVTSLRASARSCVAAAIDLLDDPRDETMVRRLRSEMVRLSEVLLLVDGQIAERRALPRSTSPRRVRRWIVDLEIRMDELVNTVIRIAEHRDALPPDTLRHIDEALRTLGWAEVDLARRAAVRLGQYAGDDRTIARLGEVCRLVLDTMDEWLTGRLLQPEPDRRPGVDPRTPQDESDALEDFRDDRFEPVIRLFGQHLPGSASVAGELVNRSEAAWWAPAGWRLTTRQAIQAGVAAALALTVGELISPQRYYWAVITAFIVFTGTATSSETVRKSAGRIVGTALGLIAAVFLANLTGKHPAASFVVIMASIFLAFYLQRVSQAAMIFFITIVLGQLYGLLHTFSDELLLIRLIETAAGGLIGALTALVVLPAGTRATLRQARTQLMTTLGDLLAECGRRLTNEPRDADLMAAVIDLDAGSRQVVRISTQMIRGRYFGSDRVELRHRVGLLGACAATGRAIAVQVAGRADFESPPLARACSLLRDEAGRLADCPDLARQPPDEPDRDIAATVRRLLDESGDDRWPALNRALLRLADTMSLLTVRIGSR